MPETNDDYLKDTSEEIISEGPEGGEQDDEGNLTEVEKLQKQLHDTKSAFTKSRMEFAELKGRLDQISVISKL